LMTYMLFSFLLRPVSVKWIWWTKHTLL